jgi:hypothetical protein
MMGQERLVRVVEGAATGLAAGTALVALGALAVASFAPERLPAPYWIRIPGLRTDTLGTLCFVVATVALAVSEALRIARARPTSSGQPAPSAPGGLRRPVVLGSARALTAAGTALVLYLSLNSVTHPWSLALPASHLLSWPTESTLRVAGVALVTVAAAVARFARIGRPDE